LFTKRKAHTPFRFVPTLLTLNNHKISYHHRGLKRDRADYGAKWSWWCGTYAADPLSKQVSNVTYILHTCNTYDKMHVLNK